MNQTTPNTHHPIAIIGGGVSGLMLARLLHLANIDFTVFERDESANARLQGGTLDMHEATGQSALKQAKLFDAFKQFARYHHQGVRVYDEQANILFDMNNDPEPSLSEKTSEQPAEQRPEIDRGELRKLLLDSFPNKHMAWHHHTKQVIDLGNGKFQIDFDNQPSIISDFVVGADGAWSKVRPLLSDHQPTYVGTTYFDFTIQHLAQHHPRLAQLVGNGMCIAGVKPNNLSNPSAEPSVPQPELTLQLNGDGSTRLYARLWVDSDTARQLTKAQIQAYYQGWNDSLVSAFDATDNQPPRPWMIYTLPQDHQWQHRANITLIGDAAHLMPPSGEGANLALKDAADLAKALCQYDDPSTRDKAMLAFEQQMFQRSHAATKESLAYTEALRSGLGIQALLNGFAEVENTQC